MFFKECSKWVKVSTVQWREIVLGVSSEKEDLQCIITVYFSKAGQIFSDSYWKILKLFCCAGKSNGGRTLLKEEFHILFIAQFHIIGNIGLFSFIMKEWSHFLDLHLFHNLSCGLRLVKVNHIFQTMPLIPLSTQILSFWWLLFNISAIEAELTSLLVPSSRASDI